MAASRPREGGWAQGTALVAVIPQVKTLGGFPKRWKFRSFSRKCRHCSPWQKDIISPSCSGSSDFTLSNYLLESYVTVIN